MIAEGKRGSEVAEEDPDVVVHLCAYSYGNNVLQDSLMGNVNK